MRSYQGYVRCANYFMTLRLVMRRAGRLAVPLPVTGRPAVPLPVTGRPAR